MLADDGEKLEDQLGAFRFPSPTFTTERQNTHFGFYGKTSVME